MENPAVGHVWEFNLGGEFVYEVEFVSETEMRSARKTATTPKRTFKVAFTPIRDGAVYMMTFQEENKTIVVHFQDYEKGTVHSNIIRSDMSLTTLKGTVTKIR